MSNSVQAGRHRISLDQAKEMTTLYRKNRTTIVRPEHANDDILAICETFDKEAFQSFFDNPDCKSIRIYYGMSPNLQVHAIIVGADANNQDMLPAAVVEKQEAAVAADGEGDDNQILEESDRCPDWCPPPSPLN